MPRHILIEQIKELFHIAKKEPRIIQIMRLPGFIRIFLGGILVIIGIIWLLTPLPLGTLFLIVGISLIIWLKRARSTIIRCIHFTRLHIIYAKVYMWWKKGR
jgi:hypothetical protein